MDVALELKRFRDRLFHTGRRNSIAKLLTFKIAMTTQRLLESTLLGMLGVSNIGSLPWSGGPEPIWEYPGVDQDGIGEHSILIEGDVREKDGRVVSKGNMKIDCDPRKIAVSGSTEDRAIMAAGESGPGCASSGLSHNNQKVSVDVAFTSIYRHPRFLLSGLKVSVDNRREMVPARF